MRFRFLGRVDVSWPPSRLRIEKRGAALILRHGRLLPIASAVWLLAVLLLVLWLWAGRPEVRRLWRAIAEKAGANQGTIAVVAVATLAALSLIVTTVVRVRAAPLVVDGATGQLRRGNTIIAPLDAVEAIFVEPLAGSGVGLWRIVAVIGSGREVVLGRHLGRAPLLSAARQVAETLGWHEMEVTDGPKLQRRTFSPRSISRVARPGSSEARCD